MKERPVIFNSEMVRAILNGRKTQTRRVMKVQPSEHFHPMNMSLELDYSARWYTPGVVDKDGYLQPATGQVFGVAGEDEGYACPFGAVGERLWVRETWSDVNLEGAPAVAYRADNEVYDLMKDESLLDEDGAFNYQDQHVSKYQFAAWYSDLISGVEGNWRPSIHMPRWASRILLEITAVRVERLQDISKADAIAEGGTEHFNIDWFGPLWASIYGVDSWNANPWVWVIEFRRVEVEK